MKRALATAACAALLGTALPASAITFNTFVSGGDIAAVLGQNNTIGFAYAGDKFVGSVYFGANNGQLYATDLDGTNVRKFGTPIPGASGEMYVSSSLGVGGFGNRDVYVGHESAGSIYRVRNDGSSVSLFTSGLGGDVRSIAFDPYGKYGLNMVVATQNGKIYTVNSAGTATLLADIGQDTEGLDFAPQGFGSFEKGTLFVASEGSGRIRAISPAGVVTDIGVTVPVAEMLSFVPLTLGDSGSSLEGFYAASYPNNIVHAPASEFAAYKGDAIVTSETSPGSVYRIHWNGTAFETSVVSGFPAQPEDGIFVTRAILNPVPEPETYAMMLTGLGLLGAMARRRQGLGAPARGNRQ